jgi:hypothetical protein
MKLEKEKSSRGPMAHLELTVVTALVVRKGGCGVLKLGVLNGGFDPSFGPASPVDACCEIDHIAHRCHSST